MAIEQPTTNEFTETIAIVKGQALTTLPKDLYIPPDALEIILEAFEGPMDLLLYLIKKQNLDILDIPITQITQQYMHYIELMQNLRLELAAEYLLMAAMLAEIKSRMLLPKPNTAGDDEGEDPRAELVRRLQEYERFKKAAEDLDSLPRVERNVFPVAAIFIEETPQIKPLPSVDLKELLYALQEVLQRAKLYRHHHIRREVLSVRERMTRVLSKVRPDNFTRFDTLFDMDEGRLGVVITFIAILELLKQMTIEIVQAEPYAPIHIKAIS